MAVMSKPREYIGRNEFAQRLGITIGTFSSSRARGYLPDPQVKIKAGQRSDGRPIYTDGWTESVVEKEVQRRAAKREAADD